MLFLFYHPEKISLQSIEYNIINEGINYLLFNKKSRHRKINHLESKDKISTRQKSQTITTLKLEV
jgi:hypothetical protein